MRLPVVGSEKRRVPAIPGIPGVPGVAGVPGMAKLDLTKSRHVSDVVKIYHMVIDVTTFKQLPY